MTMFLPAGLFIIGVGIGMAFTSVIPIPDALGLVKNILWFILIIAGVGLIIASHK